MPLSDLPIIAPSQCQDAKYTAALIFAKGDYNAEFHALDQQFAEAARSTPGYLGEETWENQAHGLISNVYYWKSMDALRALMKHPKHLVAQAKQARRLAGYRIVVSHLLRMYGDEQLQDRLPVTAMPA